MGRPLHRHGAAPAFALALGLVLLSFPLFQRPSLEYDAWFMVFGTAATAAILVGVHINRPARRLPWYLIAAGQLSFLIGDSSYVIASAAGREVPYPSFADAFYLAGYFVLAAGLLQLIRSQCPGRDRTSLIDAAIVTVGFAAVTWVFAMEPYVADSDLGLGVKLVTLAYPAMDLLLIAVAARMIVSVSWRQPTVVLLGIGLVFQLVGDFIYSIGNLDGWYYSGHPIDLTWPVAYVAWGAMALHPTMVNLTRPLPDTEHHLGRWRLILLSLSSVLAPVTIAIQAIRGGRYSLLVTIGASIVLFGLVIARLVGTVTRNQRLAERELALRETAAAFVGSRSSDEIASITAASALRLAGAATEWTSVWLDGTTDVPSGVCFASEGATARDAAYRHPEQADTSAIPIDIRGRRLGLIAIAHTDLDFSARDALGTLAHQCGLALEGLQRTEERLERQSAARFRSLVQNSSDIILVTDRAGIVRYHTPSAESVLGYREEDITGHPLDQLVHPGDRERLAAIMGGNLDTSNAIELRLLRQDGSTRFADVMIDNRVDDRDIAGVVVTAHDVTERKALEDQLGHQAFHDPLTGLANRSLFHDRVTHALQRRDASPHRPVVFFLDLDDFKSINDSLGHSAGDHLLTVAAGRLARRLRIDDTLARLGGDEFAVLLESTPAADAERMAGELLATLSEPMTVMGTQVITEASIGIAVGGVHQTAEELLRDADAAMYRAKSEGKARIATFEATMHAEATDRLRLRTDLRQAVSDEQFELVYQPIVMLTSGEIVAFEALARWTHPEHGPISPLEFIPAAEQTGMIVPLGAWVLRTACCRAMQWLTIDADGPAVSVNLSARQLEEPSLLETVERILAETGLPPEKLILEITETVLLGRTPVMVTRLQHLRTLGIRVAIDDFGTGYSSLSYLQGFPVDILKIAKPFVDRVDASEQSNRLLGAIVQLGISLELSVIAEGVELDAQADQLRALHCGLAQGYLFDRPMDSRAVTERLAPSGVRDPDLAVTP